MPATKAKPRSAKVAKAKPPSSRRRMARATAVPATPGHGPLTSYAMVNAAYYAAGCVAVALGIGVSVEGAAINPRWKHEAEVDLGYEWERNLETWHLICLAGPFAQRFFRPGSDWRTGCRDFDIVKRERTRYHGQVWKEELRLMETIADRLVAHFSDDVDAIAKALLKHQKLTGLQIQAVVDEARRNPRFPQCSPHRLHPLAHYRALAARCDVDLMQAAFELEHDLNCPPTTAPEHVAFVIASDQRFEYFGTAAFAERLLALERKMADGVAMTPKRMANVLNTTPKLLQEFSAHFAKPGDSDDTVMLYANGRAFVIPAFGPSWAPGG
jgi:hypothetical protein